MNKCFIVLLIYAMSFNLSETMAKDWRIAEDWKIVYWDVERNEKSGANTVTAAIEFAGMGNSGILTNVELCGRDLKSKSTVCKVIDYGRVRKMSPVKVRYLIGWTKWPIYDVYLREEN